jgi:rubrerythrin
MVERKRPVSILAVKVISAVDLAALLAPVSYCEVCGHALIEAWPGWYACPICCGPFNEFFGSCA